MHQTHPKLPWFERASDWLNPILIKETRQSLKSRQFIATFMLVLVASWMVSVFGTLFAGPGIEYRSSGKGFFYAYYLVLGVAIYIVVPFSAFRSLLSERDMHTYEVLSISTLSPRQIVWGKLLSTLVQMFIYYSAIAPFMAFTILLKGIDSLTIGMLLAASMIWSMALSMIALTISTFASQRRWQSLLTLKVLGGLIMALAVASSMVGSVLTFGSIPFDEPEFWWILAAVLCYFAAFFVLLLQISVAQLTFDADNRSTGIRLATAAIFWMSVGWICLAGYLSGASGSGSVPISAELLRFFAILMGLYWSIAGLFVVTEPDMLSRRVRRDVQRFGRLRMLAAPWMPGGNRGLLFVMLHLAALWLFVVGGLAIDNGMLKRPTFAAGWAVFLDVALDDSGSRSDRVAAVTAGICLYATIYLGLAAAIARSGRTVFSEFRPSHARVMVLMLGGVGAIMPHLIDLINNRNLGTTDLYDVTDPFSTLASLGSDMQVSGFLRLLCVAALAALAINLRAMIRGVIDVATAQASIPASHPASPPASPPAPAGRHLQPADENGAVGGRVSDSVSASS